LACYSGLKGLFGRFPNPADPGCNRLFLGGTGAPLAHEVHRQGADQWPWRSGAARGPTPRELSVGGWFFCDCGTNEVAPPKEAHCVHRRLWIVF
jgi:hypothetical protein